MRNAGTVWVRPGAVYCDTSVTTLETGRWLTRRQLDVLEHHLVILRQRLHRRLGPHRHDLVAFGLQPLQYFGQGFRGVLVEVVHQDDALALLVQLLEDDVDDLLGVARLEVEGVEVAGEDRDVALCRDR